MDDTGNLLPAGSDNPESGIANVPDSGADTASLVANPGGLPLVAIQLTPDQITEWWDEIEQSREMRKRIEEKWDILYQEYLPVVTKGAEDVRAGIHFRNVHTKISKLFFKQPDLILTAEGPVKDAMPDPLTGMILTAEDSAKQFQAVLNKKLGRKGVKVKRLVGECLFDILAWSGLGCSKIGYRNVTKPVQEPVTQPDPAWVPPPPPTGSILGLQAPPQPPMIPVLDPATGQPMMKTTEVTIYEEWYWSRFSPKKLLLPADLKTSRFDEDAPWMGMEFFMPETVARSTFKIPPGVELKLTSEADDRVYQHEGAKDSTIKARKLVRGVELYYKANIRDATEPHPQAIRQLVLIDGDKDKVYVHRPSPDQTFDELGKLTEDSLVGFPYQIFTNRDMADSPYIWADNAFTNSSVKHINTHRRQSVKLRDANIGKFLYDSGAFTPDEITRLKNGEVGEWIAVMDGRLAQGADKLIAPVVKNEPARDDYRTAQALKQDVEETLGIGGPNAGAQQDTVRTATEIATSASALADRMEDEQGRILECYLEGVEKFAALIMRWASEQDYIQWVGQDGNTKLNAWNKDTISARWAFDAKPDSQLRVDVARDRAQTMQFLEVAAAYPMIVNPKPIFKKLATQFNLDPTEVIMPDLIPGMPVPGAPPVPGSGAPPIPPGATGGAPAPGPSQAQSAPTGAQPNAPAAGQGPPQLQHQAEAGGR